MKIKLTIIDEENFPEAQKQFDYLFVKFHARYFKYITKFFSSMVWTLQVVNSRI